MTILHIITGLDGGGAEKTLLKICKLSNKSKFKHYVVSLQNHGILLDEFKKYNIKVFNFKFNKNVLDVIEFIKLFKLIKKLKPKTIMTWLYHADFIGLFIRLLIGKSIKLVWNIRCSNINFQNYSFITKFLFKTLKFFSNIPDIITFNSYKGMDFHVNEGFVNNNIKIIPNFIDTNFWKFNQNDRKTFREKKNIKDNIVLISNIGRYDLQKDHKTFINFSKSLIKKNKNVKFLLIGKNTKNIKIDENIKEYFIILDYQNEIKRFYSAIDLIVLSSSYGEGFSNVILESMSMSVPCIVSDVGDNKRIICNDDFVFQTGNSDNLMLVVENFINLNSKIKSDLQIKNRKIVKENYESAIIFSKFNKVW